MAMDMGGSTMVSPLLMGAPSPLQAAPTPPAATPSSSSQVFSNKEIFFTQLFIQQNKDSPVQYNNKYINDAFCDTILTKHASQKQNERPVHESFFTPPEGSPPTPVSRPRPIYSATSRPAAGTTASRVAAASALLGATARPADLAGPSSSSMGSRHLLGAAALSPPSNQRQRSPTDSMSPPSPCPPLESRALQQPLNSLTAPGVLMPVRCRGRRNSRPQPASGSPGSSPHDSMSPPDSPSPNHRDALPLSLGGSFARQHQGMITSGCKYLLSPDQISLTPSYLSQVATVI